MTPVRRVLVANRGEIALRIIRACRELGLETVAVYSEADRGALHTKAADEAVCIGPAPSKLSYLNPQNILAAALSRGADAVHPGCGYLSEDALFAEMCRAHNLLFIGPPARQLELLGDKVRAKEVMRTAGVPVIPGRGAVSSHAELVEAAEELGYPVLIKATSGGGGIGLRLARDQGELLRGFDEVRAQVRAAFQADGVYLEKYLRPVRHIEVQVLGDSFGSLVHCGERECSLQRRHQKLLEECPSPAVSGPLRASLTAAALKAAEAAGFCGTGTVEFLLDEAGDFYFLEVNPRLQVEHPVTELVYGLDLVREQIRLAAGEPLGYQQGDLLPAGHAIECRINAEDVRTWRPAPGAISRLVVPGGFGVRWDSHVFQGYSVPPFYDSLLGKLIVWGATREEAIARMARALDELILEGLPTTIPFHRATMRHAGFRAGFYSTDSADQWLRETEIVR